jgi:predicted DNA-binding transcriptional regulator AlpA
MMIERSTPWPLLLDEEQMSRMLSLPKGKVRAASQCRGDFPKPQIIFGLQRWHRDEVEKWAARQFDLDLGARLTEARRNAAMECLNAWDRKATLR